MSVNLTQSHQKEVEVSCWKERASHILSVSWNTFYSFFARAWQNTYRQLRRNLKIFKVIGTESLRRNVSLFAYSLSADDVYNQKDIYDALQLLLFAVKVCGNRILMLPIQMNDSSFSPMCKLRWENWSIWTLYSLNRLWKRLKSTWVIVRHISIAIVISQH